jgi:hypothetical protein
VLVILVSVMVAGLVGFGLLMGKQEMDRLQQ